MTKMINLIDREMSTEGRGAVSETAPNGEPGEAQPKEETPLRRRRTEPKKHHGCSQNTIYHFQSFAENASIDGIKFLGETGRTIPERIFWALILTVALALCIHLVIQTFHKWIGSPVLVSFATSQTPIFEIPFPAVTICPQIKAQKHLVNYTDIYLKATNNRTLTEKEEENLNYMALVCSETPKLLNENVTMHNKEAIDFLIKVAPTLNDVIFEAEWKTERFGSTNIRKLFTPIVTSDGICFTFNGLDRRELFTETVNYHQDFFQNNRTHSDWIPDEGYAEDSDIDSFPRRTLLAGANGGLSISLMAQIDNFDFACDSFQGFTATLHHPAKFPDVGQNYFRIPLDQSVVASIKPEMITTSEDLRGYSVADRNCYFATDRQLKFFRAYNQRNCLVECLTDYTLKECGCVGFHLPKEESTPICSAAHQECMDNAKVLFLSNEISYKLKTSVQNLNRKDPNTVTKCDCLPACNSLDYDVETSQAKWNLKEYLQVLRQTNRWNYNYQEIFGRDRLHVSRLTVFFKSMQFLASKRDELYSHTDFWANIGGIVGLFTGFSFVTMFEIIYYLTLRIICNIKMFGRKYWSGAPELLEEAGIKSKRS